MTFEYSKADLSNVKVGDKVVIRNGSVKDVERVSDSLLLIDDFGYRFSGECLAGTERDAVWVIGTNAGPVDLNEYDLERGIYAISSDGKVLVLTLLDTDDTDAPAKFAPVDDRDGALWYSRHGSRLGGGSNLYRIIEICAPKKASKRVDLSTLQVPLSLEGINLKEGDTVLLRDGTTQIVDGVNLSGPPYKIGNLYYKSNGVCNIDVDGRANDLDVIALVERTAPKDEDYFKDLAVSLLSEISGDRLLSVPSSVVLEIVKGAHSDVEPNKVSTAFVALLEGFSRSNESIKLPAKALRDLISL